MERARGILQVGDVLNQRYHIQKQLGKGAFAEAFAALDQSTQQPVAVKVLTRINSLEDLELFSQEAYRMMGLKHPNIVTFVEYVPMGSGIPPFIVMKLALRGSLQDELKQSKEAQTWIPARRSVTFLEQAAGALQYIHWNKLIHRDVKPANLLQQSEDELLVSDLGIAKQLHRTESLVTGEFAGTLQYAAPEQIRGRPEAASDQYALGITAYYLLTGNLPFNQKDVFALMNQQLGETPPDLLVMAQSLIDKGVISPKIINAVTPVVRRSLEKDPDLRHPSVVLFTRALRDTYYQAAEERSDRTQFAAAKPQEALSQAETVISPEEQKKIIIWDLFQKGIAFSNQKNYPQALGVYNLIIQHEPNNIYALLKKGDTLTHLRRYTEAIDAIDHVIQLDPRNIYAFNLKGIAQVWLGQHKEAIASYDQAITIDPTSKETHNNKGIALNAMKKYKAAIASYDRAITIDPEYSVAYYNKGIALSELMRFNDAIDAYNDAITNVV